MDATFTLDIVNVRQCATMKRESLSPPYVTGFSLKAVKLSRYPKYVPFNAYNYFNGAFWPADYGDALDIHGARLDKESYLTKEVLRVLLAMR